MKVKIISVLFLFFVNVTFATQTRWIDESGKVIEQELLKELKTLPKERHFEIYVQAARNFFSYKVYDKSLEYYSLALKESDTKQSKKESHLRVLQIHYLLSDWKNLKQGIEDTKRYFDKFSKEYDEDSKQLITFYEMKLPENSTKISTTTTTGGLQLQQSEHNLYALMKQEKYQDAFSLLDRSKLEASNIAYQLSEYDLLNVLINKQKLKNEDLLCLKISEKFKDSFSYPVIICDILKEFLTNDKVSENKISQLNDYLTEFSPSKKFLVGVIKKL